jgi:hypothetical protein
MIRRYHFRLPIADCQFSNRLFQCIAHTAFCVLLAVLCAFPFSARSQSVSATLSGTVIDQNGAVVPGVEITVINPGTGLQWQTTTNDQGNFVVPLLPPSTYTVRAQRDGFAPVQVNQVILNVGDNKALKIELRVGKVNEMVQINADAPLINESPAVGTVVDRQFVENIPLNGRSFQPLITLTPGVVLTKANINEQGQFSVNGQRADSNYFTIDGASANIGVSTTANLNQAGGGALPGVSATGGFNNLVSVDALQEFKIQTSTYAPEFGRSPGAQVSIVTRSGTNEFRGSLFEYFRNDALDATDWFTNSRRQKKPPLRQNDFGFVIGGPILLPRFGEGGHQPWYNGRNKTFFFLSYEGLRLRQPLSQATEVPSLGARQSAPEQIKPFLNAFPIPNGKDLGGGKAEFSGSYSDPSTLNATSIRIDHSVSSKLNLFGRYNYAPSGISQRGASATFSLNTITITQSTTQTLTFGSTLAITPSVTNELRFNYSRNSGINYSTLDSFGGAIPLSDSAIFPSFASSHDSLFFFFLNGVAGGLLAAGKNVTNLQRQVNLVNNLSVVAGTHQLKFGADYRRIFPIFDQLKYQLAPTFLSISSALTGKADQVSITADAGPRFPIFNNVSVYGQDSWKVTRRLTLTYGLRWELNPPPSEATGNVPFAVIGIDNLATLALAPRGTPLYRTTHNNFAPRIGVAYQFSRRQGRETVFRGGVGIFYDLGYGSVANAFTRFPYTSSKSLASVLYPLTPAQAAPATLPDPLNPAPPYGNFSAVDPNLKLPRTYQWNFAIEQSLGTSQTISASYVGAVGRRLLRQELLQLTAGLNPALFGSASRVNLTRNAATSDYHAMQLQFQRRLSRGFQALASYTWSHSIDSVSNDSSQGVPTSKIDPQQDRGASDFDVRHSFSAAVTYNIPSSKAGAVAKAISRNWFVDTIFSARTGTPVDVVITRNLGFGSFSFRPDLVPGVPLYLDDPSVGGGRRFNKAAFAIPIGRQGTLGRNSLRGFSIAQVDFAVRRQFNLTERVNLQFRAEAFNVFNHPNFADPNGVLGSVSAGGVLTANSLFGQSTQMLGRSLGTGGLTGGFNPLYQIGGPRSIQLALKLQF